MLTVPSNDCWQSLRPGDRIIAIFPSPDTLVAERSVAWRVGPGDRVEQSSSQDVTGVPTTTNALIETLQRLVARVPATSTDLPNPDQSSPAGVAGVGTLVLLAFIGATMWTLRPPGRSQPRNVERRIAERQAAAPMTCGLVLAGRLWRQIGQPVGRFALVEGDIL